MKAMRVWVIIASMRVWVIIACVISICGCSKTKAISFEFDDVGLLSVGDPIIYRGIKIGKVKDVNLHSGVIVVDAKIDIDAPIRISDTGYIQNAGMFGERQIVIASGASKVIANEGDVIIGVYKKIEIQSMGSLNEFIDTIQSIRERFLVKKLLDSISTLNERIKTLESKTTNASKFQSQR